MSPSTRFTRLRIIFNNAGLIGAKVDIQTKEPGVLLQMLYKIDRVIKLSFGIFFYLLRKTSALLEQSEYGRTRTESLPSRESTGRSSLAEINPRPRATGYS